MNLDEKLSGYLKEVNKVFPELRRASALSMYSGDYPTSGKIELGNQSIAFKNKFNYQGDIIHYTSFNSLLNILDTYELRMYNCNNLNDRKEIGYAQKELGIKMTEKEITDQQQNYFVFSASEYDSINRNDDFNLWRLYGENGNGVGIVFEVTNISDTWFNVFYGKVNYGLESGAARELIEFVKLHQEYNDRFKLFENIPSIIPVIALHFKNPIWSIEKEVRFIAYCPFDKYQLKSEYNTSANPFLSDTIKHTINRNGKQTAYLRLPLNIQKKREEISKVIGDKYGCNYIQSIPHLKMKKLIMGHNISPDVLSKIESILEYKVYDELGYKIQIEYSSYRDMV